MTSSAVALVLLPVVVGAAGAVSPVPTPIGAGSIFHPSPSSPAVEHGLSIGALRCTASDAPRSGVHLELFARGRVVIVPAGIGVAPPVHRRGVYVISGGCSYPARTREPTGVIEVASAGSITLGDFFSVWGRALTSRRLLGFRAPRGETVRAYVNGRRRRGNIRSILLRRHDQIVLEIESSIPPHVSYRFPKGL